MEKVFIVAAKRTPIGAFTGSLKNITAGELAGVAIKGALESVDLSLDAIDEVIVGNVISAGQGMGLLVRLPSMQGYLRKHLHTV